MTGDIECRYCGGDFTSGEMALLRALIAASPPPNRHALSREFCRRIGWFRPDGGLKDMMARVTMLAMHNDGLITLPRPKWPRPARRLMVFEPETEPPLFSAPTILNEVRPLSLRPVVRYTREGKRWNEIIARYHYLGYKTLVGAQMGYAVYDRDSWPLAMLGFSTAARKLAPRDHFIGWTPQLREMNLPLVIDNPRFLILPWITIPNLGSHILSLVRRQLPAIGPSATTPRRCSSRPSSRPRASQVRCTRRWAGYSSEPPKDGADTTATPSATSPGKTSGCGPFGRTGSELSTGEIMLLDHPG